MIARFERFSLAIFEISRCWHKLAAKELMKLGLKGSHARYLTAMYKYPQGITVPQLCTVCGKDKSDASRTLSALEAKGLVTKQRVGGSLYRGVMLLTDKGRRASELITERASRVVAAAGRGITDEEREVFYRVLDSVTVNLRKLCKEGIPD